MLRDHTIQLVLTQHQNPKEAQKEAVLNLKMSKAGVKFMQSDEGEKVQFWRAETVKTGGSWVATEGLRNWDDKWTTYNKLRREVRHRHIAQGILKGKRLRQIETLPTNPKKVYIEPDWKLVSKFVAEGMYYYGMHRPKHKTVIPTVSEKPVDTKFHFGDLFNFFKKKGQTVTGRTIKNNFNMQKLPREKVSHGGS